MKSRFIFIFVPVLLLLTMNVSAQSFCATKAGAVSFRATCKKNESVVNLAAIGATGTQGPAGAQGVQGPAGSLVFQGGFNPRRLAIQGWNSLSKDVVIGNSNSASYAIAFDGAKIWVSDNGNNLVKSIDPVSGNTDKTVSVNAPTGLVYDGLNIWVASQTDGVISKINPISGVISPPSCSAGVGPTAMAFDINGYVWVISPTDNTVRKISTGRQSSDSCSLSGQYALGGSPSGIIFDGSYLWITIIDRNVVKKINPINGVALASYPTGPGPSGLAYDGDNVWIVNADDSLSVIQASDGFLIAEYSYPGVTGLRSILFDGASMWVTGSGLFKISAFNGDLEAQLGGVSFGLGFDGASVWTTTLSNIITKH
jgi:streptogramin lyase